MPLGKLRADRLGDRDYPGERPHHHPDLSDLFARIELEHGLRATSRWLRQTFANPRFEIHEILFQDDRVAARVTMHARQHGTFLVYDDESGKVTNAFPSTGRKLAVLQTHWFRMRDGKIAEHDAVRDDLDMAKQLKWLPPTPAYLIRMLLALRRERQRQRRHA